MQWWLVSTSPSGEAIEAEQPVVSRTEAPRRWSSQPASSSTPSAARTWATGASSKGHIPSSAAAGPAQRIRIAAPNAFQNMAVTLGADAPLVHAAEWLVVQTFPPPRRGKGRDALASDNGGAKQGSPSSHLDVARTPIGEARSARLAAFPRKRGKGLAGQGFTHRPH